MPTMTISLELPEGTRVNVRGVEGATVIAAGDQGGSGAIQKYWDEYLSDNGRKVFAAAARVQDVQGTGFTFEDLAQNLSLDYESVKSMHRLTGRTAKRWRKEQGTDVPIELLWQTYEWDDSHSGNRTAYYLEPPVCQAILALI